MTDERFFPNKQISFTHAVTKDKSLPVFLLQGKNPDGESCWCYLEADAHKDQALQNAAKKGDLFTLSDYGRIITSGAGETPPDSIVGFLREEHIID